MVAWRDAADEGIPAGAASGSSSPHCMQNLAAPGSCAPQCEQIRAKGAAHAKQNLACGGFSVPQDEQRIVAILVCYAGTCHPKYMTAVHRVQRCPGLYRTLPSGVPRISPSYRMVHEAVSQNGRPNVSKITAKFLKAHHCGYRCGGWSVSEA